MQHALHDSAGMTRPPLLAEIGDVPGVADQPVGPDAHQIPRARSQAHAMDGPAHHSAGLAIALTAATVIAPPPRRPSTPQPGPGARCPRACFASAPPTTPTRHPLFTSERGPAAPPTLPPTWTGPTAHS